MKKAAMVKKKTRFKSLPLLLIALPGIVYLIMIPFPEKPNGVARRCLPARRKILLPIYCLLALCNSMMWSH